MLSLLYFLFDKSRKFFSSVAAQLSTQPSYDPGTVFYTTYKTYIIDESNGITIPTESTIKMVSMYDGDYPYNTLIYDSSRPYPYFYSR